jgi:hypothetical protein
MSIIMLLWWSLSRGNPVVLSRWQGTAQRRSRPCVENDDYGAFVRRVVAAQGAELTRFLQSSATTTGSAFVGAASVLGR